jgi:hypothetical protein
MPASCRRCRHTGRALASRRWRGRRHGASWLASSCCSNAPLLDTAPSRTGPRALGMQPVRRVARRTRGNTVVGELARQHVARPDTQQVGPQRARCGQIQCRCDNLRIEPELLQERRGQPIRQRVPDREAQLRVFDREQARLPTGDLRKRERPPQTCRREVPSHHRGQFPMDYTRGEHQHGRAFVRSQRCEPRCARRRKREQALHRNRFVRPRAHQRAHFTRQLAQFPPLRHRVARRDALQQPVGDDLCSPLPGVHVAALGTMVRMPAQQRRDPV